MKLNKKTAGALIFTLLCLLLFFSRTIYTYNMPIITGARPGRGSLSQLEIVTGIARWAETEAIYAAAAGAVGRVFVREGDKVEEGQVLFEMDFDVAAVERRYAEIANNIRRLEADIQSTRSRLNNIREALVFDHEQAASLSGQAGLISLEINRANLAVRNAQISYEQGFQSRNDFINAQNNLLALLLRYEAEAEDLEHSLILKQIDLANLRLSRDTVAELLMDFRNNAEIKAPAAGTILKLSAERGMFFPEHAFLVSIGVGHEFIVECNISLDNNFVNPGDICDLSNANHMLKGTVWRVRPEQNNKTVSITIISEEVNDGETFEITFEKNSSASFTLVPSVAINRDNDGHFVYQIKRRRGIMGDEYYLERLNIFIGDSDHQNTSVVRGITFFDPIVLTTNKVLSAGITVSLRNPEDFFEN